MKDPMTPSAPRLAYEAPKVTYVPLEVEERLMVCLKTKDIKCAMGTEKDS